MLKDMPLRHVLLATIVAIIWGSNFVFISVGLRECPPLTFLVLRFTLVALPAVFCVKLPRGHWRHIILIALATNVGQFTLFYIAMAAGMPTGLVGVVLQVQVVFTTILAAVFLGEKPGAKAVGAMMIACLGLAILGMFRGEATPLLGVLLTVAAGASWAVGNVIARSTRGVSGMSLVVWTGAAALPGFVTIALAADGPTVMVHATQGLSWQGWLATGYTAIISTLVGYGLWNHLLTKNPTHAVTKFALLIPAVSLISAWLVLGDRPNLGELVGSAVAIGGVSLMSLTASKNS